MIGIGTNISVQASVSAPMPLRSSTPETTIPTAQLVRIKFTKKAASAKTEAVEIEAEKRDGEQRDRHHADGEPDEAHDHQRAYELDRTQRADHQVAEVTRPHLLEKRYRETELPAEQYVPEQDRADKNAGGTREESGVLGEWLQKPHTNSCTAGQ